MQPNQFYAQGYNDALEKLGWNPLKAPFGYKESPSWSAQIAQRKREMPDLDWMDLDVTPAAKFTTTQVPKAWGDLSRGQKFGIGGGAALGALGLGAGAYALHKHLKNKEQQPKEASFDKEALFGLGKKPVQAMQPFSMSGLPEGTGDATSLVRQAFKGSGPSRVQQFDTFMNNRGAAPAAGLTQQAASSGIKAPTPSTIDFGSGIAPAAGDALKTQAAAKPGLLSGTGGKVLGGLALAGGAAYLYNKYRQNKQNQQAQPQQYYGAPQQMGMPAMQGGY